MIFTFGTVFRHLENFYVWLVEIDDVVYTAKILDESLSKSCQAFSLKQVQRGIDSDSNLAYAFVILTTQEWNQRAC